MSWIDTAIDAASQPIEVDVSDLGMGVDIVQVIPLSANEYSTLKAHPDAAKLSGQDKDEWMGMRMVFEMLAKCDDELSWGKFRTLPISLLGQLSGRVTASINGDGGALGES